MKRRTFLATTGLLATTGCLGRAASDGDESSLWDDTTTEDDTTTQNETTTRDDTATPGDHEASCPSVHDDVDATVCSGGEPGRGVSFGQNTERLAAGEVLEVTLVNEDVESVGLNPHDWAVYRETDAGWEQVDPGPTIEPWVVLESGDRLHWRVGIGGVTTDTGEGGVYGGSKTLDPGTYAFAVTADVAGAKVSLVAPFTVE